MNEQNNSVSFTFRISRKELEAIERLAKERGQSVSEYIRRSAALHPVGSILDKPQIGVLIGLPGLCYTTKQVPTYSENLAEYSVIW
jgi:hypothetical protein